MPCCSLALGTEPICGAWLCSRGNRALPFSLEGCELEAECGILESDGLVTAHQQPEETEGK